MATPKVPNTNINSGPAIRLRVGHTKARTGCVTCKARRLKCDETRPSCNRCIQYSGECGGYTNDILKSRHKAVSIIPKPKSGESYQLHGWNQVTYPPSTAVFKTDKEQRYLFMFLNKISIDLAGFFEGAIWTYLLPQACQVNTSIRNGVVAVVAASFVRYRRAALPWMVEHQSEQRFALQHYDTAVKELRKEVLRGSQNLPIILAACFVIICFENLFGTHDNAIAHSNAALKLAFEQRSPHYCQGLDPALVQAFVRLDVQMLCFKDSRPKEEHMAMMSIWQEKIDMMPRYFTSPAQGKTYLVLQMQRTMHYVASINGAGYLTTDMHKCLDGDQRRNMEPYAIELERWNIAFQPLLSIPEDILDPNESLVLISLQLHYQAFYLIVSGLMDRTPSPRKYMPQFTGMVMHAKRLLAHPKMQQTESLFTADLQFIAALFLCAVRCPHRLVRREAIALMAQSSRREGLWDSILSAKMAEFIVDLEESLGLEGDFVRTDLRMLHLDINTDLKNKNTTLECYMPVPGTGETVIREMTIKW